MTGLKPMLRIQLVFVPDWPLSPHDDDFARKIEPAITEGLGDEIAWYHALGKGTGSAAENVKDPRDGNYLPSSVWTARCVYGNRPSRRKRHVRADGRHHSHASTQSRLPGFDAAG